MAWVICVAREDGGALAPLRLVRGIEVAEKDLLVWIRGSGNDEKIERLLRSLPAVARYELSSGNRLRNIELRIPSETLPALDWQPLNKWLRVQMSSSSLSHFSHDDKGFGTVHVRIVRSAEERPIDLLVTNLAEWREFALNAAEIRLRHLRFAADATGDVVVRGKPLPPLPGRQFVLHGNIAVQAGFAWEPAVSAEVLSRRLGLGADVLALLWEDGTFSRIEAEQFVPATRSAVRETAEGFVTK